jgi:hypothetical protein
LVIFSGLALIDPEFTVMTVSQDTGFPRIAHILQPNEQKLGYSEKLVLARTHIRHLTPIIALERIDFEKAPMRCQTHIAIGSVVPFGANVIVEWS